MSEIRVFQRGEETLGPEAGRSDSGRYRRCYHDRRLGRIRRIDRDSLSGKTRVYPPRSILGWMLTKAGEYHQ